MKKNAFFKAINAFLAVAGAIFVVGMVYIFLTNAGGLSTFIGVWSLVKTQSLYDINDSKVFEGAAAGIVSSINDPYSNIWIKAPGRFKNSFGCQVWWYWSLYFAG